MDTYTILEYALSCLGVAAAVIIAWKFTTRVGRVTHYTFSHDFNKDRRVDDSSSFFTNRDFGDEA